MHTLGTLRSQLIRSRAQALARPARLTEMPEPRLHRPPTDSVVEQLLAAGVSRPTALAMERWKAQEVLDLLRAGLVDRRGGSFSPEPSGKL